MTSFCTLSGEFLFGTEYIIIFCAIKNNLLGPETRTLDTVAVGCMTFATLLIIESLEEIDLTPEIKEWTIKTTLY